MNEVFPRRVLLWTVLAVIVALGVWMRAEFVTIIGAENYISWADNNYYGKITRGYLKRADEIREGRAYKSLAYPPGYPLLLACLESVGVSGVPGLRLTQGVADAFAAAGVYVLCMWAGAGLAASLAAGLAYAVYQTLAAASTFVLAEALSPGLFILVLLALVWTARSGESKGGFRSGLAIGLATMVRPDFVLLVFWAVLWFVWSVDRKRLGAVLALFAVGLAVTIGSWGAYNRIVNGAWVFTSTSGGAGLWEGLGEVPNKYGYVLSDKKTGEILSAKGLSWHSLPADRYLKRQYLDAWKKRPRFVLRTIVHRWKAILTQVDAWGSVRWKLLQRDVVKYGPYLCLLVLVFLRRNKFALLVGVFPVLYALLSIGFVHFEARYVRYINISYIISAALLVGAVVSALKRRWKTGGAIASGLILAAGTVGAAAAATNVYRQAAGAAALRSTNWNRLRTGREIPDSAWSPTVANSIVRHKDGSIEVTTDDSTYSYQIVTTIPVAHWDVMAVRYVIKVQHGGAAIGLVSGATNRWIDQDSLGKPGVHSGLLKAYVGGERDVQLVVTNYCEQKCRSRFTLEQAKVLALPGASGN